MHPTIPPEILLRHMREQAARDRRISAPRHPVRRHAPIMQPHRLPAD